MELKVSKFEKSVDIEKKAKEGRLA